MKLFYSIILKGYTPADSSIDSYFKIKTTKNAHEIPDDIKLNFVNDTPLFVTHRHYNYNSVR